MENKIKQLRNDVEGAFDTYVKDEQKKKVAMSFIQELESYLRRK